jgi:N-methylhydantoinase A
MTADRIVSVDVGGTFTDVVAVSGGRILTSKVPTNPMSSDQSVLAGAAEVRVDRAAVFNLASTAGINSVITRRLPKVALLTTEGHRDVLDGGRIGRPLEALMDIGWRRSFGDVTAPLVERYLRRGIRERMLATGEVFIPFDEEQALAQLEVVARCEVEGVAICLINAYVNGEHERRLRDLVRKVLGDVPCSMSSEVSPLAKEYVRCSTTVVDVLMKVIYTEYTRRLQSGLTDLGFTGQFNYADSRAMLLAADFAMERPYELVAGGPAGGTVASAHFGRAIGDDNLVCADVGGTSTDISIVTDGRPVTAPTFELEYDLVVNAVSNEVITLGAGGGSVVAIGSTGEVMTGPDSAGAVPGPACYGTGGTRPTVTDAALLMGILDGDLFLGGKKKLNPNLSREAFDSLDTSLSFTDRVRYGWQMGLHNIAEGLLNISIRRGIDLREYSLVAFGAAGPMILPGLLDVLPMRRVIVPPHPGLFGALGLASSDRVYSDHRCAYLTFSASPDEVAQKLDGIYAEMERSLIERLGADTDGIEIRRSFDGRLLGQNWELPFVEVPGGRITQAVVAQMASAFHDAYEQRNGNRFDSIPVEGVVYRVQLFERSEKVEYPAAPSGRSSRASGTTALRYLYDEEVEALEYDRGGLVQGDVIVGPAIVREELSTTLVPRGRTATVGNRAELIIE